MKFNNRENECTKTEDGRTIWLSRSVAVVGVVLALTDEINSFDDVSVLVTQRGKDMDNANKWCLPCGYLDWDESAEDAIVREIYEESNLNIRKILNKYKNWNQFSSPWKVVSDPTLDQKQNVSLYYGALFHVGRGALPKTSNKNVGETEVKMVGWQKFSKLDELDWAFNHRERIDNFVKFVEDFLPS